MQLNSSDIRKIKFQNYEIDMKKKIIKQGKKIYTFNKLNELGEIGDDKILIRQYIVERQKFTGMLEVGLMMDTVDNDKIYIELLDGSIYNIGERINYIITCIIMMGCWIDQLYRTQINDVYAHISCLTYEGWFEVNTCKLFIGYNPNVAQRIKIKHNIIGESEFEKVWSKGIKNLD